MREGKEVGSVESVQVLVASFHWKGVDQYESYSELLCTTLCRNWKAALVNVILS